MVAIYEEPIAPTIAAIDAWRAQGQGSPDSYGVNVWTKASMCRCISGRTEHTDGHVYYFTIRGEGSSNSSREYPIRADKIVRAVGWIVGERDARLRKERQ